MTRLAALAAFACLLGAAAPPRPTPNAPPGPAPAPSARSSPDPAREAEWEDPRTEAFIRAVDWTALEGVLVQEGGRKKPLGALAREVLWRILNAQGYRGQPPVFTYLSIGFDPAWEREKALKAGHPELAKALGGKRVSLMDLGSDAFETLRNAVEPESPGPRDRAVLDLEQRATRLRDILGTLKVLPGKEGAPWVSMADPGAPAASVPAFNAFVEMERAYASRDAAAFDASAALWASACRAASPAAYADSSSSAALEMLYYRIQPFRWGCLGYFLAFLAYLGAWVFGKPGLKRGALGLLLVAFALHGLGMAARVVIAGRPPVSNMYEVILYVAWAVVAVSFLVEGVMRQGVTPLPASGMAALGLVAPALFPFIEGVVHSPMPLDPHIGQLQAVLKSNYWLTVHVCTITTSYAILFLGFAPGIWHLVSRDEAADRVAYRVNQLGFLFLTCGILTGAWWANASWGRYWGWDPKETGSFIAWCLYGAYLHLRLFGFLKPRGAAWLTVAGFVAILFTMIGVGYFLPGLHSYA